MDWLSLPTFFRSFQTAESLAAAMISRGFGYDIANRTELTSTRYRRLDWIATLGIVVFLICSLTISILGLAHYTTTIALLDHCFFTHAK
jgi:energy-coupling factor transport system permease protein